ncbi:hypothetical protein AgCh_003652 [Apium graveolens]
MGPPTVTQRLNQLEEKPMDIEATMADMVIKAVEAAVNSMKQSLTDLLVEGQATTARKQEEGLEALVTRLEGRVNRFREHQEQMATSTRIRDEAGGSTNPTATKIHPVLHASQPKKHVGTASVLSTIPQQLTAELELQVQFSEALLGVRKVEVRGNIRTEALIKWTDLPQAEATWEDVQLINDHFPLFHLEDKVKLWREAK